ncbi:MAG: isoaspartyl peptidase/L-asparaginase [Burkholderiaceae bacterium]|nr:isoaspartyl peptidase/L-asparaginase [Burkholderiaceae bacterium]
MIAIGIHGGCGTLPVEMMGAAQWDEARAHLADSLRAGWAVLARGGSALDAVEAAVVVMEDSPYFNAGFSAAMNAAGEHELDASIMDGADLRFGGVCAARRIRNPVRAARALLENGPSVLLTGPAADDYAAVCGIELVENRHFTTERQVQALASLKARAAAGTIAMAGEAEKHGTVGAVALDAEGNLAAATSTGGFNNKPVGRVGDSPIAGAGTYARNGVCAVSGTGQGEVFIRRVAAYDVAARMMYAGQSLEQATDAVVHESLSSHAIGAGMVAIDARGCVHTPFNTIGMYRGWVDTEGNLAVASHEDIIRVGRLQA